MPPRVGQQRQWAVVVQGIASPRGTFLQIIQKDPFFETFIQKKKKKLCQSLLEQDIYCHLLENFSKIHKSAMSVRGVGCPLQMSTFVQCTTCTSVQSSSVLMMRPEGQQRPGQSEKQDPRVRGDLWIDQILLVSASGILTAGGKA